MMRTADQALLLARDPWHLFVAWSVAPATRIEVLRLLGAEAEGACAALRLGSSSGDLVVHDLPPEPEQWSVDGVVPGVTYTAEIGIRTSAGRFVALVRARPVTTPPASPSHESDVRWVDASIPTRALTRAWSGRRVPHADPGTATGAPRSSDVFART